MGSTRRSFTAEYKVEAVNFVLDGGRTITEVARNIGCHELTLGKWVKKEKDARKAVEAATEAPLGESDRLRLIRVEAELKEANATVAELRMQVEFAKKWRPGSRKTSSEIRCYRGLG
jgi:transposase